MQGWESGSCWIEMQNLGEEVTNRVLGNWKKKEFLVGVVETAVQIIRELPLNHFRFFIRIDQFEVNPEPGKHKSNILVLKCFTGLRCN